MDEEENETLRIALTATKDELGWSVTEWCNKAGIRESTLRNFLASRSRTMTHESLRKLAKAAHISIDALVDKSLHMKRETARPGATMIGLKELDVRASGGDGALMPRDDEPVIADWQMPEKLVSAHTTASHQRIRIIQVIGDSMVPEFSPGDRIMVDTTDCRPSPPGVFVVWDGLGLVVKRCEYVHDEDIPAVKLMSANPAYEPRLLPLADVHINGRVIGKWMWT